MMNDDKIITVVNTKQSINNNDKRQTLLHFVLTLKIKIKYLKTLTLNHFLPLPFLRKTDFGF